MKRLCLLLVVMIVLAGCEVSEGLDHFQCDQDVCINIKVDEPVLWDESIVVRITVTTKEDFSELGVTLESDNKDAVFEESESEEPGQIIWKGDCSGPI
jgi:uncharacterized lipoprotein YehR (DUF1307 family)